jgi:predicted nucleotidyltransferase
MALLLDELGVSDSAIASFCERWGVARLAIFGSAARRELRDDSDVDVMVEFAPDIRRTLFDLVDMRDELSSMFGRPVDMVERASILNPYRRKTIDADLKVVYAA